MNMAQEKDKGTPWDRVEAVIKMSKMSTNAFAKHIGLMRGENLYQIKRGNNGISVDVADRICENYPKVNKLWLLTGEGTMLSTDKPIVQLSLHERFVRSAMAGLLAGGHFQNIAEASVKYAKEAEAAFLADIEAKESQLKNEADIPDGEPTSCA